MRRALTLIAISKKGTHQITNRLKLAGGVMGVGPVCTALHCIFALHCKILQLFLLVALYETNSSWYFIRLINHMTLNWMNNGVVVWSTTCLTVPSHLQLQQKVLSYLIHSRCLMPVFLQLTVLTATVISWILHCCLQLHL
jgi:hypothetical protein